MLFDLIIVLAYFSPILVKGGVNQLLASAYFMMFKRLSEDQLKATRQNIGLAPNSICSILHYFISTCNDPELRFESDEALMKTLQMNIRVKLTEGEK